MKRNIIAVFLCFNLYAVSVSPVATLSDMWIGLVAYSTAIKSACLGPSGICTVGARLAMSFGNDIYTSATRTDKLVQQTSTLELPVPTRTTNIVPIKRTNVEIAELKSMLPWCEENSLDVGADAPPVAQEINALCREARNRFYNHR